MSATILKDRCLAEIVNRLNENATKMLNLRFQPAQAAISNGAPVGVLPAITAEQIGMIASELNAERRALMEAAGIVEEQHKALIAPEEAPDALVEGKQPNGADRTEAVY